MKTIAIKAANKTVREAMVQALEIYEPVVIGEEIMIDILNDKDIEDVQAAVRTIQLQYVKELGAHAVDITLSVAQKAMDVACNATVASARLATAVGGVVARKVYQTGVTTGSVLLNQVFQSARDIRTDLKVNNEYQQAKEEVKGLFSKLMGFGTDIRIVK